jgi:hypothetical protein
VNRHETFVKRFKTSQKSSYFSKIIIFSGTPTSTARSTPTAVAALAAARGRGGGFDRR